MITTRMALIIVGCWLATILALACAATGSLNPLAAPTPKEAEVDFDPTVTRIVIPGVYRGSTWICTADPQGLRAPDCVRLKRLRQLLGSTQQAAR